MSTDTTYKCDCCGKEQKTADGLYKVGIVWDTFHNFYGPKQSQKIADWCRNCMVQHHLIRPHTTEEKALPMPQMPPSLEELIRDIVREELNANS